MNIKKYIFVIIEDFPKKQINILLKLAIQQKTTHLIVFIYWFLVNEGIILEGNSQLSFA